MRSQFFGNRLLDADPFFTRAYNCPPPDDPPPPGGGGGGGKKDDPPPEDLKKQLADEKSAREGLEKRLAALEGKKKDPPADDPDLQEKAKREREAKEKAAGDTKAIEKALQFSLGAKDWLKNNASLLPKDVEGIFSAAEKEKYDSAIDKDQAIKASLVQTFFSVQSNLDLLTPSQKSALEDFLKLTKNGKQEKAQQLYDNIFEPTFEMLKRLKKAEQLGKDGHTNGSEVENAYRDRMMKLSKKHYMGEKADA